MKWIKKKLLPVIALLMAVSMVFPAAAAPAIQYERVGTFPLEEQKDTLQVQPV